MGRFHCSFCVSFMSLGEMKMPKSKNIQQNIPLTLVALATIPLIASGRTYILGLALLVFCILTMFALIFLRHRKKAGRLSVLTWIALGLWVLIPLTFLISISGLNLFGDGLMGLASWAKTSLALGVSALALTCLQLFRSSRG